MDSQTVTELEIGKISSYSLLAGATALVPIPFLDDWLLEIIRRKVAQDLLFGCELNSEEMALLLHRSGTWNRGCLYNTFIWGLLAPVRIAGYIFRRLFRKILFVLALKEATDRASYSFHEGYLLAYAMRIGRIGSDPSHDQLALCRDAIRETIDQLDTSPVRMAFRRVIRLNRDLLSQVGSLLARHSGRPTPTPPEESPVSGERELLGRAANYIAGILSGETAYLEKIERTFEERSMFPAEEVVDPEREP